MTSPGRIIGISVGAIAILGIGVYGPAMLLGPLPDVTVRTTSAAAAPAEVSALTLPETGASASAGDPAAVPIGGAAKLVTLLVTLDSLPLPADGAGPAIPIGPEDYVDYLQYSGEGSRALPVSPG